MKKIKIGLAFFSLLISIFFINNVKAYVIETYVDIVYDEEYIYNGFSQIDGFDINNYSKIFCYIIRSAPKQDLYCYAFVNDIVFTRVNSNTFDINSSPNISYYMHHTYYGKLKEFVYKNTKITFSNDLTYSLYSNFDIDFFTEEQNQQMNVLDFSKYMSEQPKEMEIISKVNTILDFMLEKSQNIINFFITNQTILICIGILLVYMVFMGLYKRFKE